MEPASGSRVVSLRGDFEPAGDHAYCPILHEQLGTKGTILVGE
jgi:plastocyanin